MKQWPDRRILDLFGIEFPLLLAPMAGAGTMQLAIAVSEAGWLGALPCALLTVEEAHAAMDAIRRTTAAGVNVNFFCHEAPVEDIARTATWKLELAPFYHELGLNPDAQAATARRQPFDETFCRFVEDRKPEVVSFHFGLPPTDLLKRVKASGARVISSATTVTEARWLEAHGCDAIIAQGSEAGGHRGNFLSNEPARQVGTFALVPQVVDAVSVPVIAAGGVTDARGIVAAFALGAAAVQIGTAFLFCPEAQVSPMHLSALQRAKDDSTALTNIFTGRPARGFVNRLVRELGPLNAMAPTFPLASEAIAPLRAAAESAGSGDFSGMWSGQAAALGRVLPARELAALLAEEALAKL